MLNFFFLSIISVEQAHAVLELSVIAALGVVPSSFVPQVSVERVRNRICL